MQVRKKHRIERKAIVEKKFGYAIIRFIKRNNIIF